MAQTTTKRSRKNSKLKSFNPRTGEVMGEIRANTVGEVKDAVEQARKVAPDWALMPSEGRARYMRLVRNRIYERMDDIIETVAAECGKPRAEALAHDIVPTVLTLQYLERVAPKALRPQKVGRLAGPLLGGLSSRVEWRPYGVVGCISPWNYPFWLAFQSISAALFAGNAVVLKPTEVTPGVGERIREVLEPLPPGVATVVQGGGDVGAALVDAPCDKIVFTGSPPTGRKIAAAAAKHLTPVVMELGGQDAAIVCEDADLDFTTSGLLWGSFLNAGQTCCAVERAYVVDSIADDFEQQLVSKLQRVKHGDEDSEIGSLTAPDQLDVVKRQVSDAIDKGAKVLAGGDGERGDGSLWYTPTVLEGRSEDMDLYSEEIFGPVLPIVRVRDEDEAIRRANEEGFNLTASVWSKDTKRADEITSRLKAGTININDHAVSAGLPWAPWGGVGESGYGRLSGEAGLREVSVPVHVGKYVAPMKRITWYPYDRATTTTLRAVAELLSAPTLSQKAGALKSLLSNVGEAIKNKI